MRTTLAQATENVRASLRLFGQDTGKSVTNPVLSSNVGGLSLDDKEPADPGVAVWFEWDGAQRCIAVDRYKRPQENVQAIHHILEARRTEMRHGGLNIVRQTFKGFVSLPAPPRADEWWSLLGVRRDAPMPDIEAAYRTAAKRAHPDAGGSAEAMAKINAAIDAARRERA